MASVKSSTGNFSEAFYPQDDDDVQPLDLSLPSKRDRQTSSPIIHGLDHTPSYLVKKFSSYHRGNNRCPSPYSFETRNHLAGSPYQDIETYPATHSGSPLYVEQQTPSPAYYRDRSYTSVSKFSYYLPQQPPDIRELSSMQHPSVANCSTRRNSVPASFFCQYDENTDPHINIYSRETIHKSEFASPPQHNDDDGENTEGPVYMDLSSTPLKSTTAEHGAESPLRYREWLISRVPPTEQRNTEGRLKTHCSPLLSSILQGSARRYDSDILYSDNKNSDIAGGGKSHSSTHNFHKAVQHQTSAPTSYRETNNRQHIHPKYRRQHYHRQQIMLPDSSSGNRLSPTTSPNSSPNNPYASELQPKSVFSHSQSPCNIIDSKFGSVTNGELSSHPSEFYKNGFSEMNSNILNQLPSMTSTNMPASISTSGIASHIVTNMYKRHEDLMDFDYENQAPSKLPANENAVNISFLDLWISKILMERSTEIPPPSRPCNVDYISTADGEKRIRLRLVDLIELQVEQSLKA